MLRKIILLVSLFGFTLSGCISLDPPGSSQVGAGGPALGLTTDTSETSSDQWTIQVNSVTKSVSVSEYVALLRTSSSVYDDRLPDWSKDGYTISLPTGSDTLDVGDRLTVSGPGPLSGSMEVELIHTPTGERAGSIQRNF